MPQIYQCKLALGAQINFSEMSHDSHKWKAALSQLDRICSCLWYFRVKKKKKKTFKFLILRHQWSEKNQSFKIIPNPFHPKEMKSSTNFLLESLELSLLTWFLIMENSIDQSKPRAWKECWDLHPGLFSSPAKFIFSWSWTLLLCLWLLLFQVWKSVNCRTERWITKRGNSGFPVISKWFSNATESNIWDE